MRKPGDGEISNGGYTYYWSGTTNGAHLQGLAVAIFSRLKVAVVEVTEFFACVKWKRRRCFTPSLNQH